MLLPLVDKPIIQYGVEEALAAGCDQIIKKDELIEMFKQYADALRSALQGAKKK